MPHSQWHWKLVDDFVENFNKHRENYYSPSEAICIDESISRWYGHGGFWINYGLPMYINLDRKPEGGCEIQDACDGQSKIMIRYMKIDAVFKNHSLLQTIYLVVKYLLKYCIMSLLSKKC